MGSMGIDEDVSHSIRGSSPMLQVRALLRQREWRVSGTEETCTGVSPKKTLKLIFLTANSKRRAASFPCDL